MRTRSITSNLFLDSKEREAYERAFNRAREQGFTAGESSLAGETARVNYRQGFAQQEAIKQGLAYAKRYRENKTTMLPFPVPRGKL